MCLKNPMEICNSGYVWAAQHVYSGLSQDADCGSMCCTSRQGCSGGNGDQYCLGFPGDLGCCCWWNWDILPGIKAEAQRLNEDSAWLMMVGASPLPVSTLQLTFQDFVDMLNNRIAVVVPVLSQAGHWVPHLAPFFWQCTDLDPNVLTQSADSPPPPPPADSLHSSIPPKFPLQMPHLENHPAFNNR